MKDLSASIVVYKNSAEVSKTIQNFLESSQQSTPYILDDAPTEGFKSVGNNPRIIYGFNNRNLDFGTGHNAILGEILNNSKYDIILKQDVYFNERVLHTLYQFMDQHPEIGQAMPKVHYPDGLQPPCKLLPMPKTSIKRRFLNFYKPSLEKENYRYDLRSCCNKIIDVAFISGCLMFLRTEALKKAAFLTSSFFWIQTILIRQEGFTNIVARSISSGRYLSPPPLGSLRECLKGCGAILVALPLF